VEAHFVGSTQLVHDPISVLVGVQHAAAVARDLPLTVALPIQTLSPVAVHLYRAIWRLIEPESLIAVGDVGVRPLFGRDPDDREPARPDRLGPRAERPKRKAWWAEYLAKSHRHRFTLPQARLVGARLGAGQPLSSKELLELRELGFPQAIYAELCGPSLTILTGPGQEPDAAPKAADHFGCETAHLIAASTLVGLAVGLIGARGRLLAVGRICDFDASSGAFSIQAAGEPPLAVEEIELGRIRIGSDGEELGYLKPWQV
jgi:polynucleotide 5'-kinase involved in rRNA processing